MIARPTFDPRYDVRVLEGDGVFLVSDGGARLLRGALYERLVLLIDGERTTGALADALAAEFEAASVFYAVNRLAQKGYVVEAGTRLSAASAIEVVSLHGLPVVVTGDYLAPELEAYNDESLRIGREWLLMKAAGPGKWFGPLFRPGITGCWQCLAHRLRQHRAVDAYLQTRAGQTTHRFRSIQPPAADASAIARELAGIDRGQLEGAVITREATEGHSVRHQLLRRPNCPACGEPLRPDRAQEPIVMRAQPKRFREDGGHRTTTPEETLARFEHHVSPVTGVVSALTRTPVDPDGVLNVYITGPNAAYSASTLNGLRAGNRTGSSGKGTSDVQARASGLCEAIERYSAVFQGDEPRLRASYDALGSQAIHPAGCMLVSQTQYAARDAWNCRHTAANRVPQEFDAVTPVEWTPVWSLTQRAVRYVPTALCYLGYPYAPHEPRACVSTSSGNAAGNTLEDAALQAVLELIERDAVALWWYSRARRPGVTLDSFDDPRIQAIRRAHADLQREIWVLDLTSDFDIPVFAALSRRIDIPEEQIVLGFGAHLDPRIAVRRALSEMNQGFAGSLARRQSGATDPDDQEADRWERTATLATEPYLAADRNLAPRAHRDTSSDDLRDDVRWCQAALERRGLEMLMLDLTRPDVVMPVVKVIVPGLRPYAPRFAAGRLYDVPVQLGWIPAMLTESQLNPLPMVP